MNIQLLSRVKPELLGDALDRVFRRVVGVYDNISFRPGQATPSTDPNTLDDYAEGTWTPTVGGNATYTTQTGTYTKIGRLVNLQFRLTINTLGTGSASTITGMPFNASVLSAGTVGFWASLSGTYVYVTCFIQVNSIFFIGATAATAGLTAPANILQNGADVLVNVTYPT